MVGEKKNSEGQRSPSCFSQPLSRLAATAPRSGSLLVCVITAQKLSPFTGKVAVSDSERSKGGTHQIRQVPQDVPPQLRLRSAAPPFHGGAFNSLSHGLRRASSLGEGAFWSMSKLLR